MEPTKPYVITMQYGYVGIVVNFKGFANVAHSHRRSRQFELEPDVNASDQIFAAFSALALAADHYHDEHSPESKGLGYVLSHAITMV